MKIKIAIISAISIPLLISILQILPVPPYAGNLFPVFRSGYFVELDRQFEVIRDAFLGIKMMSRPVYAWIFLDDIQKKHAIKITVHNARGEAVKAPGERTPGAEALALAIVNSSQPRPLAEVRGGRYHLSMPVISENRCSFCHSVPAGGLIGVLSFERDFDARVYYTWERVLIFSLISLTLLALLVFVVRWVPGKRIKEIFDK